MNAFKGSCLHRGHTDIIITGKTMGIASPHAGNYMTGAGFYQMMIQQNASERSYGVPAPGYVDRAPAMATLPLTSAAIPAHLSQTFSPGDAYRRSNVALLPAHQGIMDNLAYSLPLLKQYTVH